MKKLREKNLKKKDEKSEGKFEEKIVKEVGEKLN